MVRCSKIPSGVAIPTNPNGVDKNIYPWGTAGTNRDTHIERKTEGYMLLITCLTLGHPKILPKGVVPKTWVALPPEQKIKPFVGVMKKPFASKRYHGLS